LKFYHSLKKHLLWNKKLKNWIIYLAQKILGALRHSNSHLQIPVQKGDLVLKIK